MDENGQKLISSMTDKSIEDGYLVDDKDYRLVLQYIYEDVSTEKDAINFFKKMEATFKEENSSTDERNYLIVKGKRVNFD
ncbi:unknown [Clostridium sp. CAG:1193]|nr:unknown [Clostridium sp. CAG:1193]